MNRLIIVAIALLPLSACGQGTQEETVSGTEVGQKLDEAADQSGPAAKKVLESAAAQARGQASMAPVDQPSSFAQRAMEKAGKAEAGAMSTGRSEGPSAADH